MLQFPDLGCSAHEPWHQKRAKKKQQEGDEQEYLSDDEHWPVVPCTPTL
jgi:hypothetical protein